MEKTLPAIPAKRYFTIGEVSELCLVKPYVLRYWEQEFTQLKPMKRRGNRRYYQRHEVQLIRRIRELLYDEGFTISGARNRLADAALAREAEEEAKDRADSQRLASAAEPDTAQSDPDLDFEPASWSRTESGFPEQDGSILHSERPLVSDSLFSAAAKAQRLPNLQRAAAAVAGRRSNASVLAPSSGAPLQAEQLRAELLSIRDLLAG